MNINVLTQNNDECPFNDVYGTYTLRGIQINVTKADGARGVWIEPTDFTRGCLSRPRTLEEVMPSMARNCIVVNLDRCIGCWSCELACKLENDVALGERWNKWCRSNPSESGPTYPPTGCPPCASSARFPCTHVCPTGASYRDEKTGIVLVDKRSVGCKYCMMACPYGVRSWNAEQQVVEKCTLCNHLTAAGEKPACVKNCCGTARYYGDLDDPESDVSKVLAAADPDSIHQLPDVGNHPLTSYILSPRFGEWRADDLTQQTSKLRHDRSVD